MKVHWYLPLSLFMLLCLALAACSPAAQPDQAAAGCPAAGEPGFSYVHPDRSFCFQLPENYETVVLDSGQILVESLPHGFPEPRLPFALLNISPAGEQDAESAALALQADNLAAIPGLVIPRSDEVVAGEQAVVIDNLPGVDINRQVFFMHDGLLYQVGFYPADIETPEYEAMQELYRVMLGSFAFGE